MRKSFHTWRRFLPLLAVLLLSGCIEVQVRLSIRGDGSALVEMGYAVYQRFLIGDLVEIERNELIPLSKEEVAPWLARIPGATLIEYEERDVHDPQFARVGGLRFYRLVFSVNDLEDLRFDHVRFAWYPWGDEKIFQFRVEKDLSVITKEESTADPLADSALRGRTFRLTVEFPGRVRDSNADEAAWGEATWTMPMRALYSSLDPTIIAWARTSATDSAWIGLLSPWWYEFRGESWRAPDGLPATVAGSGPLQDAPLPDEPEMTDEAP